MGSRPLRAGGSPQLYVPVRVNNVNLAQNPVTGELRPQVYVGSFVPNTGDPYNGMVTNEEWPSYGIGFRVSQGIQPEGRVGLAWDIMGSGKTSLHASLGRYHNAFVNANGLDVLARQPPAQNNPVLRYSTIALLSTPEARAAFDTTPSNVTGFQHVAPTPKSLNYSIGVQRELGWGTVLDVTYAGSKTREHRGHLPVQRPAVWRQFHRRQPAEHRSADRRCPAGQLPAALSWIWHHRRSSEHRRHRLQLDAGATQPPLHQRLPVRARLHTGQRLRQADHRPVPAGRSGLVLARTDAGTQLHNLTISYTWDVPDGSRLWNNWLTRGALDGWQLSGNTAFVSGDWQGVTFTTTDNFDFYGTGNNDRAVASC